MARVKLVFEPDDYPGTPDQQTREQLDALFEHLCPGEPKTPPHAGYAMLAQSPALALAIAKLGDYVVRELPWAQQRDLRELSVQALNLHYQCDFSFHAHLGYAQVAGISLEQQAALPYWRTSHLFDDEQRLVIEYTLAVVKGEVPDELFARVVQQYGEKGAVEFTAMIGWWALWAMMLNAVRPEFSPERSQPLKGDLQQLTPYVREGK